METETLTPMPPLLQWQPEFHQSTDQVIASPSFKVVPGLELQQINNLERVSNLGVFWKNRVESKDSVTFRLSHGGDVDSDGNCLFSSAYKVIGCGSARVGSIVMTTAAKHVTPVALELGGKCPAIIDSLSSDRDKKATMERVAAGKWVVRSGQAL